MRFQIPKTPNYVPDEGWHNATLHHISYSPELKHCSCNCLNKVRFTFHLDTDPREPFQNVAAVTFCMEQEHGEDLLRFLQKWLKDDFRNFIDRTGSIDIDALINRRAAILIQHVQSKKKGKYDRPYCKIADIMPVAEEGMAAA